jgi:glycosyltransferase involved in cell wall biosynthesis
MNLAFATSYLYPDNFGGINIYVHELARHFSKAGHTVAVVGPNFDGRPSREEFPPYRIYRFGSAGKRWLVRNSVSFLNFHEAAERVCQELPVDRWISNDLFSSLAVQRWIARHPAHWTAVCQSLHSTEAYIENAPRSDRSKVLLRGYCTFLRGLERYLYRRVDDLVVLSSFTQEQLREGPGRVSSPTVIPGGVDVRRFYPASEKERLAIRRRLRIPPDRLCFLTVRRLEYRMGLFLLLDALDALRRSGVEFISVIGGRGSLKEALEEYRDQRDLHDHVRLEGAIPAEDLADYYRAADLFVLPTEALEGFGLIMPEAMACGCPVVGTPVGNIPNLLRSITPEFVCPDLEPAHLAGTVKRALEKTNAELRSRLVQHAVNQFDWNVIVQRFEQHWAGTWHSSETQAQVRDSIPRVASTS